MFLFSNLNSDEPNDDDDDSTKQLHGDIILVPFSENEWRRSQTHLVQEARVTEKEKLIASHDKREL